LYPLLILFFEILSFSLPTVFSPCPVHSGSDRVLFLDVLSSPLLFPIPPSPVLSENAFSADRPHGRPTSYLTFLLQKLLMSSLFIDRQPHTPYFPLRLSPRSRVDENDSAYFFFLPGPQSRSDKVIFFLLPIFFFLYAPSPSQPLFFTSIDAHLFFPASPSLSCPQARGRL